MLTDQRVVPECGRPDETDLLPADGDGTKLRLYRMHSAYYIFQFLKIADYLNFLRFPVYRQKFLETLYGMIRQPV